MQAGGSIHGYGHFKELYQSKVCTAWKPKALWITLEEHAYIKSGKDTHL